MPAKYSPEKFWSIFWSRTERSGTCLLSTIHDEVAGYARCRFQGKMEMAHRIAWFSYKGEFPPDGRLVLHTCDVRRCIEESHLFEGTHKDNAEDRDNKGRHPWGYLQGERNRAAKLVAEQVREIRCRRAAGEPVRAIHPDYGISPALVYAIEYRKVWKHID